MTNCHGVALFIKKVMIHQRRYYYPQPLPGLMFTSGINVYFWEYEPPVSIGE